MMYLLFLTVLSSLLCCGILHDDVEAVKNLSQRFIGGKAAVRGAYPWAVHIRGDIPNSGKASICGATIISPRWLVTAAHCIWTKHSDLRNPKYWHVTAGKVKVNINEHDNSNIDRNDFDSGWDIDDFMKLFNLFPKKYIRDVAGSIDSRDSKKLKKWGSALLRQTYFHRKLVDLLRKFGIKRKLEFPKEVPFGNHPNDYFNEYENEDYGPKDFQQDAATKPPFEERPPPIKDFIDLDHVHVEKIILYPSYNPNRLENDIALMLLDTVLPIGNSSKIDKVPIPGGRLATKFPIPGMTCVVIGWGCNSRGGMSTPIAHVGRLEVISRWRCNRIYANTAGLNYRNEFCAGYVNKDIGICPGDSGSGLVCPLRNGKYVLAGITSATHQYDPGNYPGVFSQVGYYSPWIAKQIRTHSE